METRYKLASLALVLLAGTILLVTLLTQYHIEQVNAQTLACIEEGHHPLECEKVFK